MSNWTPGPWHAGKDDRGGLATVAWVGDWYVVRDGKSYDWHGSDEADAHLIAASPELYEALDELVLTTTSGAPLTREGVAAFYAALDKARTALAQARGG